MCYILKTITCVLRRRNLVKNGQNNINLIRLFSYTLKHYVVSSYLSYSSQTKFQFFLECVDEILQVVHKKWIWTIVNFHWKPSKMIEVDLKLRITVYLPILN
jgi:hypothetical protein